MQASNPNSSTPTSPPEVVALYARWSGARSDTRTQVGHDFEPMYDGGDAHLGYVLAEEQPGTAPLYERWSGARSDTRTQIGDDFEPMYDGSQALLGYVFTQQRPGTVELCSRWSSARSDTRTQVGREFESMYDGPLISLGWIYAPPPPRAYVSPLYERWSSGRSDTRTQIGDDFEPGYEGGEAFLGYVLTKELPGTVPVYEDWSYARLDTRTHVGVRYESTYGDRVQLGSIYTDPQPGTVELCSRWSSARRDTRTQVGRSFESMYDGPLVSLGWIYPPEAYPTEALTPAQELQLAQRFAPIVILHEHDRNRPMSLEQYVQTVDLYRGSERVSGDVTLESLNGRDAQHYLRFKRDPPTGNDEYRTGAPISNHTCTAPAYVSVRDMGSYYRIVYAFFYALNSFQIFRMGFTALTGSTMHRNFPIPRYARHEGDWEHVTVIVAKQTNGEIAQLRGVYASQHSSSEYRDATKLELRGGRPVVYSAIHSHANYFGQQTVKYDSIAKGIGNIQWITIADTTHSDGLRVYHKDDDAAPVTWDTQQHLVLAERAGASVFPDYAGRWGRPNLDNSHIDMPPKLPDGIEKEVFALAKAADFIGKIPSRFKVNSGPFGPAYQQGGWWSSAGETKR